jgi:hypothetical protein
MEWKELPSRCGVVIEIGGLLGDVRVGGDGTFFFFGGSLGCKKIAAAFVCAATLFFFFFGGATKNFATKGAFAFGGAFTVFFLVAFGVVGLSLNLNWVDKFVSPSLFNDFK